MGQNSPPQMLTSTERRPAEGSSHVDREFVYTGQVFAPRLLRLRDAPRYLGMDKNRFNRDVRPWVTVIPIGTQGVAFDL